MEEATAGPLRTRVCIIGSGPATHMAAVYAALPSPPPPRGSRLLRRVGGSAAEQADSVARRQSWSRRRGLASTAVEAAGEAAASLSLTPAGEARSPLLMIHRRSTFLDHVDAQGGVDSPSLQISQRGLFASVVWVSITRFLFAWGISDVSLNLRLFSPNRCGARLFGRHLALVFAHRWTRSAKRLKSIGDTVMIQRKLPTCATKSLTYSIDDMCASKASVEHILGTWCGAHRVQRSRKAQKTYSSWISSLSIARLNVYWKRNYSCLHSSWNAFWRQGRGAYRVGEKIQGNHQNEEPTHKQCIQFGHFLRNIRACFLHCNSLCI
nr:uncharacterized protein LOC127336844 isoform X2 [Lolium perenne]